MKHWRIGLAVARCQPAHEGHFRMFQRMLRECDRAILVLGSADKFNEPRNPFRVNVRERMIRNVIGSGMNILAVPDIDADTYQGWFRYISGIIANAGLPAPTDYYGGNEVDVLYYQYAFPGDCIHIMNRDQSGIPSATEIRRAIDLRSDLWREWVPRVNHDIVERHYPAQFRMPIGRIDFDDSLPEGTYVVRLDQDPPMRYQRQEGKWVPVRPNPPWPADLESK